MVRNDESLGISNQIPKSIIKEIVLQLCRVLAIFFSVKKVYALYYIFANNLNLDAVIAIATAVN